MAKDLKEEEVIIRPIGAIVTSDSIELITAFSGEGAAEAASDYAQQGLAIGAEVTIIDAETDTVSQSRTFAGNGKGKWAEMRNEKKFGTNGRFKEVYTRKGMIQ